MPELPEVETIRVDLANELTGRRITDAAIDGVRTIRRQSVAEFLERAEGATVGTIRRKGKYLILDLEPSQLALVVHLRMSGQLLWVEDPATPLMKHTHARLSLDSGAEIRFVDPRTFGELWITTRNTPELANFGPDALTELSSWKHLSDRLAGQRVPVKVVLMNQEVIAGIGNIYADEILFEARLRYSRKADTLTTPAKKRLFDAVGTVLGRAVARRGSSLADSQYRDLYGQVGTAQRTHAVYAREGLACPRCARPIIRSKLGARSTYWCRFCQQ